MLYEFHSGSLTLCSSSALLEISITTFASTLAQCLLLLARETFSSFAEVSSTKY